MASSTISILRDCLPSSVDDDIINYLGLVLDEVCCPSPSAVHGVISQFLVDYDISDQAAVDSICLSISEKMCTTYIPRPSNTSSSSSNCSSSSSGSVDGCPDVVPTLLPSSIKLRDIIHSKKETYGNNNSEENVLDQLENIIQLAEEKRFTDTHEIFQDYVLSCLSSNTAGTLEAALNHVSLPSYIEDIWIQRYSSTEDISSCCLICHRYVGLTSHHVYPKETHKKLLRKTTLTKEALATTIDICRLCHSTVHSFFTNELLATDFYTIGVYTLNKHNCMI